MHTPHDGSEKELETPFSSNGVNSLKAKPAMNQESGHNLTPHPVFIQRLEEQILHIQKQQRAHRKRITLVVSISSTAAVFLFIGVVAFARSDTAGRVLPMLRSSTRQSVRAEMVNVKAAQATPTDQKAAAIPTRTQDSTEIKPDGVKIGVTQPTSEAQAPKDVSQMIQQLDISLSSTEVELTQLDALTNDADLKQTIDAVEATTF